MCAEVSVRADTERMRMVQSAYDKKEALADSKPVASIS
jgi:hypothetical protein